MVLIPGGEFVMGHEGYEDHSPPHRVRIYPFYMDTHEVTNAEYQAFCKAAGHKLPELWGLELFRCGEEYPDNPVVGVTWGDAKAYAEWRGVRLPTEAEWEYAARGGMEGKNYSLGDELDPDLYAKGGAVGEGSTSKVAGFPANEFGLHDMTGNVLEWVADWYDPAYYAKSPEINPTGPGQGRFKVLRGGGWHTGPYCSRVYIRTCLQTNWIDFNVGFRCARSKGRSAALKLEKTIEEAGIDSALFEYERLRRSDSGEYYFDEGEFNEMAYRLVNQDKLAEAIEILELNAEAHPQSYNVFDSLGEVYRKQGSRELAIQYYRKSLKLNPASGTARQPLRELEEAIPGGEPR